MRVSVLAFVAGTCAPLLLPRLPSPAVLCGVAAVVILATAWTRRPMPLAFAAGLIFCHVDDEFERAFHKIDLRGRRRER